MQAYLQMQGLWFYINGLKTQPEAHKPIEPKELKGTGTEPPSKEEILEYRKKVDQYKKDMDQYKLAYEKQLVWDQKDDKASGILTLKINRYHH
jgi:hypothetical protein